MNQKFEMNIINNKETVPKKKDRPERSKSRHSILSLSICNIVRLIYILETVFCMYYVTAITYNLFYLFLIVLLINIVIDDLFVTLTRKGNEYYWFSLTTFLFVIAMLTTIWSLVIEKYKDNDLKCNKSFKTNSESAFWKSDFKNICSFLEIIVAGFMFTTVIGRFLLPQTIARTQLFGILSDSFTNSGDSVELFSYIDEPKIQNDTTVVYTILWLFSMSTLQYCFALAARKNRNKNAKGFSKFCDTFFGTEIWSLALVCLTMDLPFFIMRFYILVTYESTTKNYTLYFFVIKNFLLVIFEIYKIVIIALEDLIGDTEDENNSEMSDRAG